MDTETELTFDMSVATVKAQLRDWRAQLSRQEAVVARYAVDVLAAHAVLRQWKRQGNSNKADRAVLVQRVEAAQCGLDQALQRVAETHRLLAAGHVRYAELVEQRVTDKHL